MSRRKPKVLVAMSGGVDSSVAAAILLREGYEVVGCFMRLGSPGETFDEMEPCENHRRDARATDACATGKIKIGHQGCCSINDAADARLVAAKLDIPFYVCNFKKEFGRIIDYFVSDYNAGRTPNPCVRCNDWLKFGKLHTYATQIDAEFVASGHYARIERAPRLPRAGLSSAPDHPRRAASSGLGDEPARSAREECRLLRGVDHDKDQSYVLFGTPRERLSEMLLPIGGMRKREVRRLAKELDLPVFDKPDSQEICFVPDNDYARLVTQRTPARVSRGRIVDTSGKVIGEHAGHQHFTIGQRRGIGIARGHPLYVIEKEAATNTIIVGEKNDLRANGCIANEANWLVERAGLSSNPDNARCSGASGAEDGPARVRCSAQNDAARWIPCTAKIRYNAQPIPAQVHAIEDHPAQSDADGCHGQVPLARANNEVSATPHTGNQRLPMALRSIEVRFDEPQFAVAPGQAVVCYDGDTVICGGWIRSAH